MERLNNTLQQNLITVLAYDDGKGKIVANIVKPELFEGDYRIIAEHCIEWWQKYGEAPKQHTPDLVSNITDDPNNRRAGTYRRILSSMIALSESINTNYVLDQLSTFTRMQNLKAGILKSAEQLNTQQELAIGEVERIWNDLLRVRAIDFDPGIRLTEVNRLVEYQNEQHDEFKTGIKELDHGHVAPYRDAVTLIIGATGRGKTWGLIHLAKQALLLRKKVVHISLEMPAEQVGLRYYQSFFGVPKRRSRDETGKSIASVKIHDLIFDDDKKLTKISDETTITPEFTLADPMIYDELAGRLEWLGGRVNNLIIKRFARMTIRDLEAYLDNLEIVEGYVPDMLILDYFGLVDTGNSEDHRIALGQAFISFRSLMLERHIAGVTAQQASKLGAESRSVKLSHVAEDWSLTNTADLVYTFSATDMESRFGLGRLYVGKARDEASQFGVLLSQSYPTGQFVLQSTYLDSHYFDLLDKLPKEGGEEVNTGDAEE